MKQGTLPKTCTNSCYTRTLMLYNFTCHKPLLLNEDFFPKPLSSISVFYVLKVIFLMALTDFTIVVVQNFTKVELHNNFSFAAEAALAAEVGLA